MACQITINPPVGQETTPGQGITTLTVSGTVTNDCSAVLVQVHQTQPVNVFIPQKNATITPNLTTNIDQWSVDFTVAAGDFPPGTFLCGKGNKYEIRAKCGDDRCNKIYIGDNTLINCGNCPLVNITVTPGACVNGRRTVHLKAEVVVNSDATYTWFFGTDEDNQPGEDSQAGDESGNFWLPVPGSNGVRVVETDHFYELTSNQPQTITVRFVTSNGPSSTCIEEKEFILEPCPCDLTVSLQVSNQSVPGQVFPTRECLIPGNYIVQVVSPVGNNIDYLWSVNGIADNSQNGSAFNFSISAGEEKTVSVYVLQGACDGSNAVTARGCDDCTGFDAQLRILDGNRQDVTDEDCLPPGNYTVQATSPTGGGNTFKWSVNNVVDTTATGATLQVNLGNDDERIITLEASRGECHDTATVVLETCPTTSSPPTTPTLTPCWIWFFINVSLFVGVGILIVVTLCGIQVNVWTAIAAIFSGGTLAAVWAALSAVNIGMIIASIALLVLTLLSFILWIVFCAFGEMRNIICGVLSLLMDILSMLLLFSILATILLAIIGMAGCAAGAFIDIGWFGMLLSITWYVGRFLGCFTGASFNRIANVR